MLNELPKCPLPSSVGQDSSDQIHGVEEGHRDIVVWSKYREGAHGGAAVPHGDGPQLALVMRDCWVTSQEWTPQCPLRLPSQGVCT